MWGQCDVTESFRWLVEAEKLQLFSPGIPLRDQHELCAGVEAVCGWRCVTETVPTGERAVPAGLEAS